MKTEYKAIITVIGNPWDDTEGMNPDKQVYDYHSETSKYTKLEDVLEKLQECHGFPKTEELSIFENRIEGSEVVEHSRYTTKVLMQMTAYIEKITISDCEASELSGALGIKEY